MKTAHTPGATRAAKLMAISPKVRQLALGRILREEFSNELAEIIDRETKAPQMLEALERLLEEASINYPKDSGFTPLRWAAAIQLAEAAIRAAKGEL